MMAVSEIAQLGAKILRQHASEVISIDDDVCQVIEAMRVTLASTQGVGIAAPQIGISKRIILVASKPTYRYPDAPVMEPTIMINPKFEPLSKQQEKGWEGCLSVPGIRALVPRYREISVSYLDQLGCIRHGKLQDFVARIFQHETDHLDGKVFLDRVETNEDIISESEYLKLN